MKSRVVSGLKLLFTPVALAYLLYFAWQSKEELEDLLNNASIPHLLVAAVIWASLHALSPLFASNVFNACGSNVTWKQAFATHAARLPARYLPGGVWHTVGRVLDYREQGVQARHLSAFVLLENGLAAAVTLAVGGAIIYITRGAELVATIAGFASLLGIISIPAILYGLNTKVLQHPNHFPVSAYIKSLLLVLIFWSCAAVAFLFYLNAFPASTGTYAALEMAGIYLFSWGVGFIAIFAPQGIGVFEVVASELMHSPIGFMGLTVLIAGFRVLVLIADLAVWTAYLTVLRKA